MGWQRVRHDWADTHMPLISCVILKDLDSPSFCFLIYFHRCVVRLKWDSICILQWLRAQTLDLVWLGLNPDSCVSDREKEKENKGICKVMFINTNHGMLNTEGGENMKWGKGGQWKCDCISWDVLFSAGKIGRRWSENRIPKTDIMIGMY